MSDATDGRTKSAESALLRTFLQQQEQLRRVAAGMGMAGADIDDVLQDVSVQVLKHPDAFENEASVFGWLIRITVNGCLTEHRRRFRRKALGPLLSSGREVSGTTDQAATAEELEIVREAMAELDPSLLELLVLRYFCDLDSAEISRMLGANASTVRSRLREGRLLLAQKLRRKGVEP